MRKPSFQLFFDFKKIFDRVNSECGLRQQLIPYFISSHPGCTEADMINLADITKRMGYKLEQVQDFTPTPMTTATEMFYTGLDPYTMEPVFTAKTPEEKLAQNRHFFWYKDTPASTPPRPGNPYNTHKQKHSNPYNAPKSKHSAPYNAPKSKHSAPYNAPKSKHSNNNSNPSKRRKK